MGAERPPFPMLNTGMSEKDEKVLRILQDLGLKQEQELNSDEEELLKRALDPEEQFLYSVKQLFGEDE